MRITVRERFKKRMIRAGSRNIMARYFFISIYMMGMIFFRVLDAISSNVKKLSLLLVSFLLVVFYSSFSFPAFVGYHSNELTLPGESFDVQDVAFADEADIDMTSIEILDDDDVKLSGDTEDAQIHGMTIENRYSSSEILHSNPISEGVTIGENGTNHINLSADDWRLVLINKQHSIPDDYEVELGQINTMKGTMQCDKRIIDELLLMISDAKESGISLLICSPYRDQKYQKMLFNRKITRYMAKGMSYMEAYQLAGQAVTVPGASEHQIGLALDIVTEGYVSLDDGFGETQAGIWLRENSCKYGFILRYPKGKEYITGIEYEPWHFRYVGKEAATLIMNEGITLEELWEDYL